MAQSSDYPAAVRFYAHRDDNDDDDDEADRLEFPRCIYFTIIAVRDTEIPSGATNNFSRHKRPDTQRQTNNC